MNASRPFHVKRWPSGLSRDAEVVEDHRDDVAQRPLLSRIDAVRACSAPEQGPERVVLVERAMGAAADVVGATPVQELPAGPCGGQHLTCRPTPERGPDAGERV